MQSSWQVVEAQVRTGEGLHEAATRKVKEYLPLVGEGEYEVLSDERTMTERVATIICEVDRAKKRAQVDGGASFVPLRTLLKAGEPGTSSSFCESLAAEVRLHLESLLREAVVPVVREHEVFLISTDEEVFVTARQEVMTLRPFPEEEKRGRSWKAQIAKQLAEYGLDEFEDLRGLNPIGVEE